MHLRFGLSRGVLTRRLAIGSAAALLVAASFLGPVTALAAPPEPTVTAQQANPETAKQAVVARLERVYQREIKVLEGEQTRLDKAANLATKMRQVIDKRKAASKDTKPLEKALDQFTKDVASAQGLHNDAQSILGTHAGFDASGKVTDVEQARKTLRDAGRAELQFHRQALLAVLHLRAALLDWRIQVLSSK
ncbi:MAG: hypothetical protein M1401_15810 [Chloroflexi bacterium]|nr:hypothetical protein [Chloroflexota bacterium]MCL5110293.1 hypothetical protein [Chloroflexota bacterium]